jgi:hypothetical protein
MADHDRAEPRIVMLEPRDPRQWHDLVAFSPKRSAKIEDEALSSRLQLDTAAAYFVCASMNPCLHSIPVSLGRLTGTHEFAPKSHFWYKNLQMPGTTSRVQSIIDRFVSELTQVAREEAARVVMGGFGPSKPGPKPASNGASRR